MFSSLLRHQQKAPRPEERTPLLASLHPYNSRQTADPSASDAGYHNEDVAHYDGEDEDEDRAPGARDGPLLPVFSEFLDRIPIYATTHAIRILVIQRCETTLSWDQLRSPQVSQFLIKPIQQQLLADHFSRGTIYCLLANCLQFRKEGNDYPGNVGVSRTRALICELLAMRLLKEFSTRELIDALSYDFDPLQGMAMPAVAGHTTPGGAWGRQLRASTRISALEVAIRAQAKKLLAHPLVVQQLEAIWAGTIVFHSTADNLHRMQTPSQGTPRRRDSDDNISPGRGPSRPIKQARQPSQSGLVMRRTVTLYDPHDASLFKLSRLRVPRYRSLFSTLSFAVMLGLFLAVLSQRSDDITALEVLFWFWSAGYMLDEVVGWSEQGFGLYIMSVWNAFDLGILFMFLVYYVLRLYGILMEVSQRSLIADMAYDVLGCSAVLLFPRLFSVLDHYRYFSQLLIAFRMMAMDLVAILLLIIITCSGFFVAFTMSFRQEFAAPNVGYTLFQLVMGFTPAAWDIWGDFNILGKALLVLFLFLCHFLIVTILITVLTNSFMAIVQNANEEHQFLFAVNTISMVKSDALFSYIAPTNIIGWLLIPFKFVMPFRRFIRMNRLIIKLTHVPILFAIFVYERLLLSNLAYEPTDLVERRGRSKSQAHGPAFSIRGATEMFSPGARLREPSITTFRKDRALEEVFRRPFRDPTPRLSQTYFGGRRKSSNVVTDWMKGMGNNDDAFPPQEDSRSLLERIENRTSRPAFRRTRTSGYPQRRRKHPFATQRTATSDPDQRMDFERPIAEEEEPIMGADDLPQQTDADGDDELRTNSESNQSVRNAAPTDSEAGGIVKENRKAHADYETSDDEYFRTPMDIRPRSQAIASSPTSSSYFPGQGNSPNTKQKPRHTRNWSSNTILFSPTKADHDDASRSSSPPRRSKNETRSGHATPGRIKSNDGHRTPREAPAAAIATGAAIRPRSIVPPPEAIFKRPTSNIAGFLALDKQRRRDPSHNAIALDLASDLGDNRHRPDFTGLSGLPASFTTQFEMATRGRGMTKGSSDDDSKRMSRIMLARMTTLEEGFRDVLKEVKGLKKGSEADVGSASGVGSRIRGVMTGGNTSPVELGLKKRKGKGHLLGARRASVTSESADAVSKMGSSL